MEGRLKRYRRGYSLLQRYRAISIRDARLAAQLTFDITNLIEFIADLEDQDQDEEDLMDIWDLKDIVDALDQLRRHLITEEPSQLPRRRPRHSRKIESFSQIDIGNLFRFRSHGDLRRLLAVWQLPVAPNGKISITDSRHFMYCEELLLFSLKRLSSKSTLHELSRSDFKNCEYSRLSRGFKYFVEYSAQTFKNKLSNDCLTYFKPRFAMYADAIRKKCNLKGGTKFTEGPFFICGFIDCNNTGAARAGAGPCSER